MCFAVLQTDMVMRAVCLREPGDLRLGGQVGLRSFGLRSSGSHTWALLSMFSDATTLQVLDFHELGGSRFEN